MSKPKAAVKEIHATEVFLEPNRIDGTLMAMHELAAKVHGLATALHQRKSANALAQLWDEVDSAHEFARQVLVLAIETSLPDEE
jgi:hypothetical protein